MKMFTKRLRERVDGNSANAEWNDATRDQDRQPALRQTVGKVI
jgi:hypothetical protein